MEQRANDFLRLSGELYESNKKKWRKAVEGFDEDVYNDSILKVYDAILKGEDTEGDVVKYWFKTFKNNLKRNKGYSDNKEKGEIDNKVKGKEDVEDDVNLYYSTIKTIFNSVRNNFDRKTFEVYRMHLLCNMSYEELDRLTGVDSKERIMKVKQWLKSGNKNFR